jgi:hypothetical protein
VKILDLTPAKRGIWFDKEFRGVAWGVPEPGVKYDLIVFDPAHDNLSVNMAKDYGSHTAAEIWQFLLDSAILAHNVSKENALMAFKWNDHDRKLGDVISRISQWWEPLFGQKTATRTARGNSTYWVMLPRR